MTTRRNPEIDTLTVREQRFIDAYIANPNAALAYRTAYPGRSYRTGKTQGCLLLKRPNIRAEIQAGRAALSLRTQVGADSVIRTLMNIATFDIADVVHPTEDCLRHPRHIPYDARKCIEYMRVRRVRQCTKSHGKNIKVLTTEEIIEYKFADKVAALEKLTHYLGLATELPPLEVLFRALPHDLGEQLRIALTTRPGTNGHMEPPPEPPGPDTPPGPPGTPPVPDRPLIGFPGIGAIPRPPKRPRKRRR
jgi:phage terminase small subunit